MRISEMIEGLLSLRKRMLNRLADVAADFETLASSLSRHAEMCSYPNIRTSLAELAEAENAQANAIRELLLQNGIRPKTPRRPAHEGSNNWERVRNDLVLQTKILRSLHSQFLGWSPVDQQIAERLRQCALEEEQRIEQLRDLTLRCDPQALD
jgi:hypothetical protein